MRGSRDSPMRCPTGELNGFPRRKSIAAAAAATNPGNQLTATASAADPSRDAADSPRGGADGGGAQALALSHRPRPDGEASALRSRATTSPQPLGVGGRHARRRDWAGPGTRALKPRPWCFQLAFRGVA